MDPLHPSIPAHPVAALSIEVSSVGELSAARRQVHQWTLAHGAGTEIAQDLGLAAYEAMANAVEHAYPDQQGQITLTAHHDHDHHHDHGHGALVIEVRDRGKWSPPPADPGWRGRGLKIIAAVCDDFDITPGHSGTTIRMRRQLS